MAKIVHAFHACVRLHTLPWPYRKDINDRGIVPVLFGATGFTVVLAVIFHYASLGSHIRVRLNIEKKHHESFCCAPPPCVTCAHVTNYVQIVMLGFANLLRGAISGKRKSLN